MSKQFTPINSISSINSNLTGIRNTKQYKNTNSNINRSGSVCATSIEEELKAGKQLNVLELNMELLQLVFLDNKEALEKLADIIIRQHNMSNCYTIETYKNLLTKQLEKLKESKSGMPILLETVLTKLDAISVEF